MKYLNRYLSVIKKQIKRAGGYILILDFDGTLSAITQTPDKAFLSQKTKQNLERCLSYFPVVIVSGRKLSDIKRKVGIKELIYAGNHGLEWQIKKRHYRAKVSSKTISSLAIISRKLKRILFKYSGVLLKDKELTLSVHYRMIKKSQLSNFKREIKEIIKSLKQNDLLFFEGKKVFEFRPKLNWTKGHFVQFISKHLQLEQKKQLLPIYI